MFGIFCSCITFILGIVSIIFAIVSSKKSGSMDKMEIISIIVGIVAIILAVVVFFNALSLYNESVLLGDIK